MNNTVPRTNPGSMIKEAVKNEWQKLGLNSKIFL